MLFREIIPVYSDNHTRTRETNSLCGQNVGILLLNHVTDLWLKG
jgi:hypothetical protein